MLSLSTSTIVVGALIAGLAITVGVQELRLADARTDLAREKQDRSIEKRNASDLALAQSNNYRAREALLAQDHKGDIDAAQVQIDALAARLVDSGDASRRLSARVSALVAAARQATPNSSTAAAGPTAGDPIGVLAELHRGADAAAERYALEADKRGVAGNLCQRDYDSVERRFNAE